MSQNQASHQMHHIWNIKKKKKLISKCITCEFSENHIPWNNLHVKYLKNVKTLKYYMPNHACHQMHHMRNVQKSCLKMHNVKFLKTPFLGIIHMWNVWKCNVSKKKILRIIPLIIPIKVLLYKNISKNRIILPIWYFYFWCWRASCCCTTVKDVWT